MSNTLARSSGEVIAAANDNRVPLVHASAPLTAAVVPVGALDKAGKPDLALRTGGRLAGMAGPSVPAERGRGKRLPSTIEALARRDAILREIRQRYFAGYSGRSAAIEIEKALLRFEATSWVRERAEDRCPQRHVGRIGELLWSLLRARDCVPSSALIRLAISRE